eukprot:TRINITY_DN18370_c0_g1_i5.p1 TRINITY_DN18370_c0_g1~~TRINITY_DN18370_c0_g1_i5.p1  ORF type:complete len:266 (+),score=80.87 TRINITY_DN18370_c0_g1_i5:167-964(+)
MCIRDRYKEEDYAEAYQKHLAHRKACDEGVSNKWDVFREERDQMLTELYAELATSCDALQGEFDEWQATEGMVCVESSMTWEHSNPTVTDDKRDRECFAQKDTDGSFYLLDWDEHTKAEFAKLCACVQARCNKIYIKHYGDLDNERVMGRVGFVKLSPAKNVGTKDGSSSVSVPFYKPLTEDELRQIKGNFHSDAERLEYMRSFSNPREDYTAGGHSYQQCSQDEYATKIAVQGVCRRSPEAGYSGLNWIVFPGKSCLDGLSLEP